MRSLSRRPAATQCRGSHKRLATPRKTSTISLSSQRDLSGQWRSFKRGHLVSLAGIWGVAASKKKAQQDQELDSNNGNPYDDPETSDLSVLKIHPEIACLDLEYRQVLFCFDADHLEEPQHASGRDPRFHALPFARLRSLPAYDLERKRRQGGDSTALGPRCRRPGQRVARNGSRPTRGRARRVGVSLGGA